MVEMLPRREETQHRAMFATTVWFNFIIIVWFTIYCMRGMHLLDLDCKYIFLFKTAVAGL